MVQILDENGEPIKAGDEDRRYFEGPWMHKFNGRYYLSYSTGTTHYLVYAEGDTWKKVVERNPTKIWINEENQHILSARGYLSWNENQEYKGDVVSTDVIDPNKEYFWNE